MAKVLVSDPIDQAGIDILSQVAHVDVKTKLPIEELVGMIPEYDAIMVRSGTKVTQEVIEAGQNLKIIGRAGVGVDNIDVDIDRDQITWSFNDLSLTLFVVNNIGGIPTGVSDGMHEFSIEESANELFLYIDGSEYGALTIGTNTLTVDQTVTSNGTSADEYTLLFVR